MTTRIRLIIISLLIAIIPMALIGILSFYNSQQLVTSQTLDKLDAVSLTQEARVLEVVDAAKTRLEVVSKNEKLPELVSINQESLSVKEFLVESKSDLKDFNEIFILDTSAKLVASSNEKAMGIDYSQEDFFNKGKVAVNFYTLKILDEEDRPLLYISAPITFNEEVLGVLVGSYNPEVLSTTIKLFTTGLGDTGETVLVAKDEAENAVYITTNKFDTHPSAKRKIDKGAVRVADIQALFKNEDTFSEAFDYRGEIVFASTRYIEELDWGLVTKMDRAEALATATALPKQIQLVGAVTLLLVLTLAWGASESIFHFMSKPIKEALDALRASESRLKVANQSLFASQTQLQELNKKLEEKVRERTKELEATVGRLNEAQKELSDKYNYIENLRILLERFTITIDAKSVMETVLKAIASLVNHHTISYVIAAGEGLEFLDSIYVWAQGSVGNGYLASIKKDFYDYVSSMPDSALNKKDLLEQLERGMSFEFLAGAKDEAEGKTPVQAFVAPFIAKSREESKIVGLFHIADINENQTYDKERVKSINDVVNIAAANIERIHALVSSEKSKISDLVQSMSNGVLMFDRNKSVIVVNPMMKNVLELDDSNLTLAKFAELFQKASEETDEETERINVVDAIEMTLVSGRTIHIDKLAFKNKFFEMFITPVRDYERKISGGAVILHDVTHMTEIDRMKTEFLSVAAHQLRTPLGSMRWNMEMLLTGDAGEIPQPIKEVIQQVYDSNQRMITLVNDLLNVSRIDQGRVKDEPELTDLLEIVKAAIVEMEPVAKKKSVGIELNIGSDSLPKIMIDPKRFREAIQNLVSNAVKFNQPDGKVIVSVDKQEEYMRIKVADTGMGIPKNNQGRLFSKFFRAENAVKSETEGSGLGLFVVKSYVEGWGGKVDFESEEGKGTVFTITLPLEPKLQDVKKPEEQGVIKEEDLLASARGNGESVSAILQ